MYNSPDENIDKTNVLEKIRDLYVESGGTESFESHDDLVEAAQSRFDSLSGGIRMVNKYAADSTGVFEPAKTVTHTISAEEEAEARRVFAEFKLTNPNAKNFPSTRWTKNPILRQASKVAYLATGGGGVHHVVDLKNEAHRKDFEHSIGYQKHLQLKYGTK